MVKRILIAIALVAFLASTAPAALDVYYWGPADKDTGVKVDGKETVRWPYEYKALDICQIPVKMDIGMYVEVEDCTDKKIVLKQVDCGDIGKGGGDFPCYLGCTEFVVRANFEVKLGTRLEKVGSVIDGWEAYYDGGDLIPGDGADHGVKVCVKAWKARLYLNAAGDQVTVGKLFITAKPNV